jgi:hypothetical protein
MASDPKDQKTMAAQLPPDVAAAAHKVGMGGLAAGGPPPPAPPPPAAAAGGAPLSSQATMMVETPAAVRANTSAGQPQAQPQPQATPSGQQRQVVVPTMMRERPSGKLPPVRGKRRQSAWGRWLVGPLISIVFAAGTVALAHVVLKPVVRGKDGKPVKPQGTLKLSTKPPNAIVKINGVGQPHFTPTEIQADVDSQVHIELTLDGYQPWENTVMVLEGVNPYNVTLQPKSGGSAPSAPAPSSPASAERESPSGSSHHEHEHDHEHHHTSSNTKVKEPEQKGHISVHVHPWAIVYVDGSRLRQTPIDDYELPVGKHLVELRNDPKNKSEKVNVVVKENATESITREWDK